MGNSTGIKEKSNDTINTTILSRITRDIGDGLIVLDMHGRPIFVNPSAKHFLQKADIDFSDKTIMEMLDSNVANDEIIEFLINAVFEKEKTHEGVIKYVTKSKDVRWIRMTTSFIFGDEDTKEKTGVLVQIADITDIQVLEEKTRDSASVFVVLMAAICLWTFLYLVWEHFDRPISPALMTKVVEAFGFVIFFILCKFTSITIKDMGLSVTGVGKYLVIDSIFTAVVLAGMIAVKAIMMKIDPSMFAKKAIFNFALWDWSCYIYPITVIVQEFLTRGVFHESIKRIMPGKHSDFWAILVSSLFFSAFHLHKGIAFMIGAFALLSVFGLVYRKQKTIWGLCIPHFVLGTAITMIFEIA